MTPSESVQFKNISATPAAFALKGGLYELAAVATWGGGSVDLQSLGPDGSTWMDTDPAMTLTADGRVQAHLPAGQYKLTVATATGVDATITRIPTE